MSNADSACAIECIPHAPPTECDHCGRDAVAGFTHAWSTDVDSRLGAQVTAHLTRKLAAVVQFIAEQNYDNTYRPHVKWANIKYQFTPEASVRIGRSVQLTFLFSDTRKVGYANPWIRVPSEVYFLVPISNGDGVDASYKRFALEISSIRCLAPTARPRSILRTGAPPKRGTVGPRVPRGYRTHHG